MSKNKIGVYLLMLVIIGYFSQGWLFEKGSIISQTMLMLWLVIDIFYFLKTIINRKMEGLGWILIVFLFISFCGWFFYPKEVVSSEGWHVGTWGDFKNISVFLLSYFPFKYMVEKQFFTVIDFRVFFWLLLVVFIMTFLANEASLLDLRETENVTNNNAFTFALLFPFLGFFFEKKYKFVLPLVMLYFIMTGAKRGALVCFAVELVLFFIFAYLTLPKKQRLKGIFGSIIAIVLLTILTISLYNSNDYLQYRLDLMLEGEDSGRSFIWNSLLTTFRFSSTTQILFGRGMDSTITISGMYAHNDWLQLLIDDGIIGVFIYFIVFFFLFRYYIKNKDFMDNNIKFMFLSAVFCWFLKTFFSMGYTSPYSFLFFPPIIYTQFIVHQSKIDDYATDNNLHQAS